MSDIKEIIFWTENKLGDIKLKEAYRKTSAINTEEKCLGKRDSTEFYRVMDKEGKNYQHKNCL